MHIYIYVCAYLVPNHCGDVGVLPAAFEEPGAHLDLTGTADDQCVQAPILDHVDLQVIDVAVVEAAADPLRQPAPSKEPVAACVRTQG